MEHFSNFPEAKQLTETAVGYARYSTQKQERGLSIELQDREMRRTADLKQWIYRRTYVDEGISGAVPPGDRPGLTELLDDAKDGAFSRVIVLDASRLARDQRIFWDVLGELAERKIVFLTCVMPDIDSQSTAFDVVAGTLQGMASAERKTIALKTRLAHEILREKGKAQGRPRLGFRIHRAQPGVDDPLDGYYEPTDVGGRVLLMLKENPKTSAKQVQVETGLPYYEAWTVLKNCRTFEIERRT